MQDRPSRLGGLEFVYKKKKKLNCHIRTVNNSHVFARQLVFFSRKRVMRGVMSPAFTFPSFFCAKFCLQKKNTNCLS